MHKRLISLLSAVLICTASCVAPVQAGNVDLLHVDFENITFEEFCAMSNVQIYSGTVGDIIDIAVENSTTGNKAINIFRKAENVANENNLYGSDVNLGFKINMKNPVASGKVNVSFKVRSDPEYRSRWKDMGSAVTSDGKTKLSLFTHATYLYGQNTSASSAGYSAIRVNSMTDSWVTVNYEIDIDEGTYTIKATQNGQVLGNYTNKQCSAGDVYGLSFIIAYFNQYYKASNSGDLSYWIDDIKISVNRLAVAASSIEQDAKDVSISTPLKIKFDETLNTNTINNGNVKIEGAGEEINAEVSVVEGDTVLIVPEDGLEYNMDYKVKISNRIMNLDGQNMASDYELSFRTMSLIKHSIIDGRRYTQGYIPDVDEMPEIGYKYLISKDEGEYVEYIKTPIDEIGNYNLKIIAEDKDKKTQEETISFEIFGAVEPEARNVSIVDDGTLMTGTVLSGKYEYYDDNDQEGENEDRCEYQWYRSDKENGEFVPIEGAIGLKYSLTAEDEDKYIKFGVKPYSKEEPKEGQEYLSDAFIGFMNPQVRNITVSGKMAEGEELTVVYEYFDINEDEEKTEGIGATVINWYTSDSEKEDYTAVGNGKCYVLKNTDNNKWIRVGIIPKNVGAGKQDKEYFSDVIIGAFAPTAKDVKIIGNLNVDSSVSVSYKYSDANSDPEGNSIIEWYVDDKLVSTSEYYRITSNDNGKRIYAVVTPVSTVEPCNGEKVKSDIRMVSTEKSKPVGSGGGGSKASVNNISANSTYTQKQDSDKQSIDNKPNKFNDISGHWAEKEILKMLDLGIVKGKSEMLFMPDDKITRAEFAAIISRVLNLETGENKFSDITDDKWYSEAVSAVSNAGYMKGADGKFRPNDNITRQEMAVVFSNIATEKGLEGNIEYCEFDDNGIISDWAKDAVKKAVSLGLLKGVGNNIFDPLSNVTRAQVVTIFSRFQDGLVTIGQ